MARSKTDIINVTLGDESSKRVHPVDCYKADFESLSRETLREFWESQWKTFMSSKVNSTVRSLDSAVQGNKERLDAIRKSFNATEEGIENFKALSVQAVVAKSETGAVVDGRIVMRGSTGGKDPKLAGMPEGDIDPMLKTITLARGEKPLVRLHYYASHPQTSFRDPRVTYDFPGMAREKLEKKEGVFQVYFTGCAGDILVAD